MDQAGPDGITYRSPSCSSERRGDWQLVCMRDKGGISADHALERLRVEAADIAAVLHLLAEKPFVTVSDMCRNTYDLQDQSIRPCAASLGNGQFHGLPGLKATLDRYSRK